MKKSLLAFAFASLFSTATLADNLKFHLFNPQENSVMPVSSVIVEGDNEVLLVDAQFQRNDAQSLVDQIKALNKPLKTIYISHFDPDYYFGLDVLTQAFPDAQVLATPETVKHIKGNIIHKAEYWSPILKENAPKALVLPKETTADSLKVGSSELQIKGKKIDPSHTYLWSPETQTVLGGVPLYQGLHLWIADNPTKASRQKWQQTLAEIARLQPKQVIAGHFIGESTPQAIAFTQQYLNTFEQNLAKSKNSQALIAKMKNAYPNLKDESSLELSAKVAKGEMVWK